MSLKAVPSTVTFPVLVIVAACAIIAFIDFPEAEISPVFVTAPEDLANKPIELSELLTVIFAPVAKSSPLATV